MRVLAVDPGAKRIGIALSDPKGIVASPLAVMIHISRPLDAKKIAELASEHGVGLIVMGQSLDEEGLPTFEGRRAARLAAALRDQTEIPVRLWDEELSTSIARQTAQDLGVSRKKRKSHLDKIAATVILQSYLDANQLPG